VAGSFRPTRLFYCVFAVGFFNAENAEEKMVEKKELDLLTEKIIGAAIFVHQKLGPGLLESSYEACLAFEISKRGSFVERQKSVPLIFEGMRLDCAYRIDLLVEKKVVVEVKAIELILPIHKAQLLSYLKLSKCKVGLLINFNVLMLRQGITRVVNEFPDERIFNLKRSLRPRR
jgi:GxxExxY protein